MYTFSLSPSVSLCLSLSANVLNHTRTREGVTHKHIHTRTQARTDARAHTPCIVMEAAIARASPEGTRACGADCRCGNSPPPFPICCPCIHSHKRTSTQAWVHAYTHTTLELLQPPEPADLHACIHTRVPGANTTHICLYACMCAYIMHACMQTCLYPCMQLYIHKLMPRTCVDAFVHAYMHGCSHTHIDTGVAATSAITSEPVRKS